MNVGYMKYMRDINPLSKKTSFAFIGNEDHFKLEALLATLSLHRKYCEIDEERIEGESKKTKISQITELLNEYPLIGTYREVVVNNTNKVADYEELNGWLRDPTEGVRLLAVFDDETKKLPETLPFDVVVVCNSPSTDSKEFLKYVEFCVEGTGKKLTEPAVETAKDLFANNIHFMRMELIKAAYYSQGTEITPEDLVRSTVIYPTSKVFDLVEAIVERNLTRSFMLLNDLMDQNVGLVLVISLLTTRVQNLADAIRATNGGERLKDYMIRKKIPLFMYEQLVTGLRLLKDIHIRKFFDVLCEYEYKLKLNQQDERQRHVAEMMILQLCH